MSSSSSSSGSSSGPVLLDYYSSSSTFSRSSRVNFVWTPTASVRFSIKNRSSSSSSTSNQNKISPLMNPGSYKRGQLQNHQSDHAAAEGDQLVKSHAAAELVKRALASSIRLNPDQQQRRREAFQPRPSRLSAMSKF